MSKYLEAYARTAIAIRNDGTTSITIPVLIMAHTGHTWAKPDLVDYISQQLKLIAESVRKIMSNKETYENSEPVDLVSEPYFLQGYDKKHPPIPHPVDRSEMVQAMRIAKLCLPIGKRSYGIRFVIDPFDFLHTFWHDFVYKGTMSKKRKREEQIMLDDKKKKLIKGAAKNMLMEGRNRGIPFGPHSPVILSTDLQDEFMSGWQRNFMRK